MKVEDYCEVMQCPLQKIKSCSIQGAPGPLSPWNRTIWRPPYLQRHVRCARSSTYAVRRLIRTSPEFLVPCILKQAQSVASELCKSEDSWSKKNLSFLQPRKLGDFSGPRFFVLITYRWFDFWQVHQIHSKIFCFSMFRFGFFTVINYVAKWISTNSDDLWKSC